MGAVKYTKIRIPHFFQTDQYISNAAYLTALMAAVVLANAVWLFVDRRPFAWDESIHYMGAVGYYRVVIQDGWGVLKNLLYLSDFYPPLTELFAGLLFLITKPSPDVAAFLDVGFICGTVWLLFLLGRRVFGEQAGILAGYLFAASSTITYQAKCFMLDIPLAFLVTLGFYAYLASENFLRRRWVIIYGVVFGLAMLNKWSAVFFLGAPPLFIALWQTLKKHEQRQQIWKFVFLSYALTAIIAGPWYIIHFIKLVKSTSGYFYARGVLENDPSLLSPSSWFYYLVGVFQQTSIPLGALVLGGLIWFLLRRKESFWMIAWMGAPYIILMLIRNKDHRYIIPLLPLLCVTGSAWIQSVSKPRRAKVLLIIALLALAQMAYSHLGINAGWFHRLTTCKIANTSWVDSWAPDNRKWPLGAILADVEEEGLSLPRKPILRVVPDHPSFSRVAFVVEQSRRKPLVQISGTSDWPMFTDFAVTKTGMLGLEFNVSTPRRVTLALQIEARAENPRFELLRSYPLPDGSEAQLYARREIMSADSAAKIIRDLRSELDYLLSAYIRRAATYKISVVPYSNEETRLGHFHKIQVQAYKGMVGDFKHNDLGVPFEKLNIEISDVLLDLEKLGVGKLVVYSVSSLEINEVRISEAALNQTISQIKGDMQSIRVGCQADRLKIRWAGLMPVQAALSFRVIPDPHRKNSQNLRFRIHSLKVGWLPVPGWFLQPMLEDFNPLFKLAGFPGAVVLGGIRIQAGEIRLGK